ncbi:MAG: TFIIB-type zinc ribbon-containing protein [Halapricum sp.]
MKIRGVRECQSCGTQWSYYETGSVECPDCGSLRSVGLDERTEHTDNPATLDLSGISDRLEQDPLEAVATETADSCRTYIRKRGFIRGGELRPLDSTFVVAEELRHVASELARSMQVSEDEQLYFLSLVRAVESDQRPPASAVPDSLASARGLAAAAIVDAYRRDLTTYLTDHPDEQARNTIGRLVDHKKRIEALDGAVPVATSETIVAALTELSRYAARGDEDALANARDRLDELSV